jgi:uncharacterized protein involved in type VI secretion and phage assembly
MTLAHSTPAVAHTALFYGVYPAIVVSIVDLDGQGRVRVRLPWSPDTDHASYEAWARIATLMAGSGRGTWFIPEIDDEVLVSFEAGNPSRPYVVGALWNGKDAPPESMDSGGTNNIRAIHSRSGIVIQFDDTSGSEKLTIETPGGQTVVLDDGESSVTIRDSNGNSARFAPVGVTVEAASKVTIKASTIEISAGMVTVNAGMSKFSGVIQADTVITNSVVSASYTPGAGNIW